MGLSNAERAKWRARERWLETSSEERDPRHPSSIRPEIETSWRRCQLIGVAANAGDPPYSAALASDSRLRRAADPIIDRLAEQLADAPATILLADRDAQIVDRRAGSHSLLDRLDRAHVAPGFGYAEEHTGTNGIGTALEERRLFEVRGGEHFRDSLQSLVCVGKPIVHPIGRTVEGVLDITCNVADVSPLMAPLVAAAVTDIEARLYAEAAGGEQALLRDFLRLSRRGARAVVTMSHGMFMATPAASRLLDSSDQALLWDWATRQLEGSDECAAELRLARETTVHARAHRVGDGRVPVGVTIELRPVERPTARVTSRRLDRTSAGRGDRLIGRSLATQRLQTQLDQLAAVPAPVLLTGEAGVGKTHAAGYVARRWGLASAPATYDAAAMDAADTSWIEELRSALKRGGAVIVRHIDDLPPAVVPAFQAVVDECVAASAPLVATARGWDVAGSSLLHAHFIRRVWISPLRHRAEEIDDLARVILTHHLAGRPAPRLQPAALQCLMAYDWPGNVRELESALGSALISSMHGDIAVQHLPAEYRSNNSRALTPLERTERETLIRVLDEAGGNKSVAAERLGIARSTLYRKMRAHRLESDRFPV